MLHKNILSFTIILLTALCFAGCAPSLPKGMPPIYPCTITLTQEGVPLKGASVALIPEDTTLNFTFAGTTTSSGNIEMYSHGKYRGIPAGKYKLVVTKKANEIQNEKIWTVSLVDVKYTNPDTSPLQVDIAKKKNEFTFELGQSVKIQISPAQTLKQYYGTPDEDK
ncbi:MAG: carboxypeptidase-like regulatory domain-containing protein [Planctomycetaceae bacterium]|jgi:PBP1b-binding outer membrane lipoprotein LpoB|nr:carboxypeptidase-like regulatory domain-containing protein [Planctomycetaceae bacterium]